MHFEALSTKYVNFNHFGWFFENFVTKFLFFWQFFLSFLVWEIILLSKNLSILGILHLSYTQREIKKIIFQTSSTCKFASWTWQGKLKQSKFSANRLELARNTIQDPDKICIQTRNLEFCSGLEQLLTWLTVLKILKAKAQDPDAIFDTDK